LAASQVECLLFKLGMSSLHMLCMLSLLCLLCLTGLLPPVSLQLHIHSSPVSAFCINLEQHTLQLWHCICLLHLFQGRHHICAQVHVDPPFTPVQGSTPFAAILCCYSTQFIQYTEPLWFWLHVYVYLGNVLTKVLCNAEVLTGQQPAAQQKAAWVCLLLMQTWSSANHVA